MNLNTYLETLDSIEWNFLIKALEIVNFGESFIKWVKVMYTKNSSIALELLAQKIRESPNIQGIFIANIDYKLTQLMI